MDLRFEVELQSLLVLQALQVFIVRAFKIKSILLIMIGFSISLHTYKYRAIMCIGGVEQCHIHEDFPKDHVP